MNLREIDELVAEKVMGFEIKGNNGYGNPFVDKYGNGGSFPFSPSTDIGDAWMVVEKLRGYRQFSLSDALNENEDKLLYRANFQYSDTYHVRNYDAYSESAPKAICLAALKSHGIE